MIQNIFQCVWSLCTTKLIITWKIVFRSSWKYYLGGFRVTWVLTFTMTYNYENNNVSKVFDDKNTGNTKSVKRYWRSIINSWMIVYWWWLPLNIWWEKILVNNKNKTRLINDAILWKYNTDLWKWNVLSC